MSAVLPSKRSLSLRAFLLASALAGAFAAATSHAGTPATVADDICSSSADPCIVDRVYDISPNAVLDFGTRSVSVTGAGEFNFAKESGRIQCGNFTASTSGPALNLAGPLASGGTGSGSVLLLARRRCTSANPVVACLDNGDCEIGPCAVRRCSLRTTKTCNGDSDCQLGFCNSIRRCSLSMGVRCATNSDCDYGNCPAQLTCTGRGDNPVACSSNSDCSYGSCTVGTASVSIDGPIAGSSDGPATLVIRAADSVSLLKQVNLNGNTLDSDGGSLSIDARGGSIHINNKINATGGGFSSGGTLEFNAGTDISIQDDISVVGGDYDGGAVDFTAGRDITIGRSILANSNSGAGYGGDIFISAGRDLTFNGVSPSNKSTIESSGHTDAENSSGDGGAIELYAERNATFDANTRVIGNGSAPDGSGSDMLVEVGANLGIHGDVLARGLGIDGSGGYIQLFADGAVSMAATANLDATGGSGGGGFVEVDSSSSDLLFDGMCDVSGSNGGSGGGAYMSARLDASVGGTLFAAASGNLTVDACGVTLESGGSLDNSGSSGNNKLVAHDTMHLVAGSSMTSSGGGTNVLRYRNPAKPPLVQGTVSPAPSLIVDPALTDCPLCGNRTVDPGESCDDGNAVNGDGCNESCQNERCISQTISPGYPAVSLCEDGNVCTADVCNSDLAGGTCEHPPKNCSDGVSCTADSCDPTSGACLHNVSDALCNDNNSCTDDFCSLTTGCSNTSNSSPCDDGNYCTNNDICTNKICKGTRINGCLFCGDDYLNPFGGELCDDGNNVNGDCCSSTCQYEAQNSPCEDGFFCTILDTCDATGTCVTGIPNTCADTDVCTDDFCDEDFAVCVNAQTPRDPGTCMVAPSTKLLIKDAAVAKRDKLSWQWSGGDGFLPTDFGTPATSTPYTLCVYDTTATTSSLKASIDIAASSLWKSKDASTLQYRDKNGVSDGVLKAQLKAGEAGKTKVKIGAGGMNLPLPAPAGATFFRQDPNVVVQLVNGAGKCWTSQFAPDQTKTNDVANFKAATK